MASTPVSTDQSPTLVEPSTSTRDALDHEPKPRSPQRPQEYLDGQWEVEPIYYSSYSAAGSSSDVNAANLLSSGSAAPSGDVGTKGQRGRDRRGLVYKSVAESDCEYKCFQDHHGVLYKPGDQVFVETNLPDHPYLIGCITMFKMTKKEQLSVKVNRYYRPTDVPEISYSLVVQERKDLGHFDSTVPYQAREVFSSETHSTHSIAVLRLVALGWDLLEAPGQVLFTFPPLFQPFSHGLFTSRPEISAHCSPWVHCNGLFLSHLTNQRQHLPGNPRRNAQACCPRSLKDLALLLKISHY
jgi:hypothetical protein